MATSYSKLFLLIKLAFIVFILSACSAIDNRIRGYENEFKTYSNDIQSLIKNGKIKTGFTETQVYIAWGEPCYKGDNQWTYAGFDCKKFKTLKNEDEYKSQYKTAWEDWQQKKKFWPNEIFIPPLPYKEEQRCRRFVRNYLYFENGILIKIENPPTITWIDDDYYK